jgi:hypothetical protein
MAVKRSQALVRRYVKRTRSLSGESRERRRGPTVTESVRTSALLALPQDEPGSGVRRAPRRRQSAP